MDERQGNKFPYIYGLKDDDYDYAIKNFEKVIEHPTGFYLEYESRGETMVLIATKSFYIEYTTGTKCKLVFGEGAEEVVKDLFRRFQIFIIPLHYEPQHFAGRKSLNLDEGCKLRNLHSHSQLLVVSQRSWQVYDSVNHAEKKKSSLDKFAARFRYSVSKKLTWLGLERVGRIKYVHYPAKNPLFAACALSSLWTTKQTLDNGVGGPYTDYGLPYLKFKDKVCKLVEKRGINKAGGTMPVLEYWKKLEEEKMEVV